jgi:hypothetical protein
MNADIGASQQLFINTSPGVLPTEHQWDSVSPL